MLCLFTVSLFDDTASATIALVALFGRLLDLPTTLACSIMILSNSAHLQLLLALAGFSLLTSAAHPAPAPKTALSPATSTSLPAPGPTSARLLAKRKKSNDESMSLVTTQITIWNRPDLKAFPSADAKNAAWLDMRKAKKVNQYPWRAGALITANSTITSKGKTLTYNEKIYNQTSKFEDKVTVIDQEKSTIRIGAPDLSTIRMRDS